MLIASHGGGMMYNGGLGQTVKVETRGEGVASEFFRQQPRCYSQQQCFSLATIQETAQTLVCLFYTNEVTQTLQ